MNEGVKQVVKHYCEDCKEIKSVFDIDVFDNRRCIECGNMLTRKEIPIDS